MNNFVSNFKFVYKKMTDLSKYELDRIIYLSKQCRNNDMIVKKIENYSPNCINYQLKYNDQIIANCFVDKIKLYNEDNEIDCNYLTELNRDFDSNYKGLGINLVNRILYYNNTIYLKPANRRLEEMYKCNGFRETKLSGIGNIYFPIYVKFIKDDVEHKFILK